MLEAMSLFDKIHAKLPDNKAARTFIGLGLIVLGLFAFLPIFTVLFIPVGIAILAFDHEWARNILRRVRDFLHRARQRSDAKRAGRINH